MTELEELEELANQQAWDQINKEQEEWWECQDKDVGWIYRILHLFKRSKDCGHDSLRRQ